MTQIGVYAGDNRGGTTRLLSNALGKYRWWDGASGITDARWARADPSGSRVFMDAHLWTDGYAQIVALRPPAWPEEDSVNRSTYLPVQAQLGTVPSGTDNVVAMFGYGPAFHCTARQEACAAVGTGQVNKTTPFYFAAEDFSGLPCASGCTLTIPAISQRILYYQIQYRNAAGTVIATGMTQVTVAP